LGYVFEKKYRSKEKEDLFFYFAYLTFISTTVRIIDDEFALRILGSVEVVEEVCK
jgi:hypothetical protein